MPLEIDYRSLQNHEPMLLDTVRCQAFQQALREVVTPECVVLDIGAGTGILSVFAAQAGARAVYAVERSPIAQFAKQTGPASSGIGFAAMDIEDNPR